MSSSCLKQLLTGVALALVAGTLPARGQNSPQTAGASAASPAPPVLTVSGPLLIRSIAASRDQIVFTFAGDLWRVGREGGEARRLIELPGDEDAPAFSPDG